MMRRIYPLLITLCLPMLLVPLAGAAPAKTAEQAPYPEEEIVRRREAINRPDTSADRSTRGGVGTSSARPMPSTRALPLTGTLEIKSGTRSTFYGKVRQELAYTIREQFVGNLTITHSSDRGGDGARHEKYGIETISTEIDASDFKGRSCSRYAGSPPTCAQWQQLDFWMIGDGEEYPGRLDQVVTASTYGQTVTIRVDGPNILFASSKGGQGVKSGCGDRFQERVSREQFRQWVRQGHIRLKKELGKTSPGCLPGSTVSLDLRIGRK
jgi:hypothetical protein